MHVVPTRPAGRTEFEPEKKLFTFPIIPSTIHDVQTFDITRDGARLIAVTIPEGSRPRQMEVVTDWTRELERLAPRGPR